MTEVDPVSGIPAAAHQKHHVSPAPPNPLGDAAAGFPKKLLIAVGVIVLAGLGITALVVRAGAHGWSGVSPTQLVLGPSEMDAPLAPEPLPPDPARRGSTAAPSSKVAPARGPVGVVTVPSAALRSGPSLTSKALRAVVKQHEKVRVVKRVASSSGPDWIQIVTASGRTGWVWASVVREGKAGRPG